MHELWTDYEEEAARQMLQLSLIGSPETIKLKVKSLYENTGMNEIMVISNIYDQKAKLYSYKLFADVVRDF
jgi:alkanesulfonate monooxygenase SsuD/methylene tetrahydromethanopterin reductase-like flavin-dependent oxidoreductase (luciferase family)